MRYSRIIGTGSYLPANVLTNADLEKIIDTTDEWITDRTGIRNRRLMRKDETTASMCQIAAERAIEFAGIDRNKIQLIIVATVTPQTLFPNTATIIQNKLSINSCGPAFDLSAACSGFIYGLSIADKFIRSGQIDYALVIGAESLSKFVDWTDRSTCILFSDGAGAVVLGPDSEPGVYGTCLHSDGSYGNLLYLSGSIYHNDEPRHIRMHGNEVFKVAVTKLGEVAEEVLQNNNMTKDAIDWLVPHQANLRIIKATAKKLDLPMEKVMLTIADQGNTSAASVPLALDLGVRDGRIKRGHLLLMEAFGAGFVWGSALVRY